MAGATLRVSGYREFVRACDHAGKDAKREVRTTLRGVGEAVRVAATSRLARIDERSAAGLRVSVRQQGVFVVQSLRKTTGKRPDYGALQMRRALLPALRSKTDETEHAMEQAVDRVADHFDQN